MKSEAEMFEQAMLRFKDNAVQNEILKAKADGSALDGGDPFEENVIRQIIGDYNEFDAEYAKGVAKTVTEMLADAMKEHPTKLDIFSRLCTQPAVMKVRRLMVGPRVMWYESEVTSLKIIRYNPSPTQPNISIKTTVSFKPDRYKPVSFAFIYTCVEGAKQCPRCGGVIEDQLVDKCPFCDAIVTDSATEKAWKITDIRRLI